MTLHLGDKKEPILFVLKRLVEAIETGSLTWPEMTCETDADYGNQVQNNEFTLKVCGDVPFTYSEVYYAQV